MPLVERLPELTPDHRVVLELSELQLPTISRGTDVAVYTHVTSRPPRPPRHAWRRTARPSAAWPSWLPPTGRLVLNAEDPVSSSFAAARRRRGRFLPPRRAADAGESACATAGSSRGEWNDSRPLVAAQPQRVRAAAIMPLGEVQIPGAHNTSNVLAAVAVGLLFGLAPDAIRRAVAGFSGVEHRLERWRRSAASRSSTTRRARSRTLSSPHCAASSRRSCSLPAAAEERATRRARDGSLQHAPRPSVLIGETAAEMQHSSAPQVWGGSSEPHTGRRSDARLGIARDLAGQSGGPAAPCCSARPRRASTCSSTTPPAGRPSRTP